MHDQLLVYIALLLVSLVVGVFGRLIRIPYTIALVLAGIAIGKLRLIPGANLSPEVLFAVLLPPLLFEGGINIKLGYLKSRWRLVLALALAGTVISMFAVGGLAHWFVGLPFLAALLFGAIISPTDPISVLAIFRRSGMNEKLTMVVESESLFNDGVAVVLFMVVQSAIASGSCSLTDSVLLFVQKAGGGLLTGIAIGYLAARALARTKDHLLCTTLTTVVAFGSYLAAESMALSGVIAVVAASLVVGNYGISKRLSGTAYSAVTGFWEYTAFAVNSIVFLLIGAEGEAVLSVEHLPLVLSGAMIVLVARACSVYPVANALRLFGEKTPARWQHMLVWSGLRGALSMAMVLGISAAFEWRDAIVSLTFGAVLFSLIVQGLTIEPVIRLLGLGREVPGKQKEKTPPQAG